MHGIEGMIVGRRQIKTKNTLWRSSVLGNSPVSNSESINLAVQRSKTRKKEKIIENAHRGARTHDHKVKSLALYQLS